MTGLQAFGRLLGAAPRGRLVGLFVLMVLASLSEGIGLLLLVPLPGVLGGGTGEFGRRCGPVCQGPC